MRFIVLFCLSVLLCAWLPELPAAEPIRLFLALHLSVWLLLSPRRRFCLLATPTAGESLKYVRSIVSCLLPVTFALTLCVQWGQASLNDRLPESLSGERFWVEGCVVSLVSSSNGSQRFEFKPTKAWRFTARGGGENFQPLVILPKRIRLSWFTPRWMVSAKPRAGECWRLALRLKSPHGFVNPGSFDYRRWLMARGIGATGYVLNRHAQKSLQNSRLSEARLNIDATRQGLLESLPLLLDQQGQTQIESTTQLRKRQALAMLGALLVGDRSQINEERQAQLARFGLSHLLAISGLHIGLAASFGYLLAFTVARILSVAAPLHVFAPRWGVYGALLFAGGYAALAGFSLPTQRALTMLLCLSLWRLLLRHQSLWQAWWLSACLVLVLQPLAGFDAGFWLSFVAVAALIAGFQSPKARKQKGAKGIWSAQWFVFFGLLIPLWVSGFGISIWSPLVNAVAIPWVSVLVVPPLLLGALLLPISETLAQGLWWLSHRSVECLLWFLDRLELWLDTGRQAIESQLVVLPGYSGVEVGAPAALNTVFLIAIALMLSFIFLPKGLPGRVISVFAMALLLLIQLDGRNLATRAQKNEAPQLWVLDVGQGLSLVIKTSEGSVLFDAGGASSRGFDAGRSLVLPFLHAQSILQLHTAVISHADRDHAGGWPAVQTAMKVEHIWTGEAEKITRSFKAKASAPVKSCSKDASWQLSNVRFDLLANPLAESTAAQPNDRSCVLLVSTAQQRVLIPGDIGLEQESFFVNHPKLKAGITGLISPHHGSLSSSSELLLDQLKPEWVAVSAGYLSRYGHPHPRVVARYHQRGISVLNTAEQGALRLNLQRETPPVGYLKLLPRYWY